MRLSDSGGAKSLGQNVVNCGLTAAYGADSHETVTHKGCLVKLDNLNEPLRLLSKIVLLKEGLNSQFDFLIDLLGDVGLFWEDISNQRLEKWLILGDEL